jgi:hypothetical protein
MAQAIRALGVVAAALAAYAFMRARVPLLPFGPFVAASVAVAGLISAGDWVAVERPRGLLRRRRKLGLCGHCGYDLHGNVSRVCPECGCAGAGSGRTGEAPAASAGARGA